MKWLLQICCLLELFVLAGCAGFSAGPDKPGEDGIRYYEPASYLLVYSDGNGNLQSEIIVMPDLTKPKVISLQAIAAKNNSTLNFSNGMLTSSKVIVDTTAVPSALVDTIKTLGTTAIASAFNAPEGAVTLHRVPPPYLFKIVVEPDRTRLIGGPGMGPDGKPLILTVRVTKEAVKSTSAQEAKKGDGK